MVDQQHKIGIIGKMASGKTTLALEFQRQIPGLKRFSFGQKVKDIAIDLFGMTDKNRELLQSIGTKMREINPDVWVHYISKKIENESRVIIDDIRYLNELEFLLKNDFTIYYLDIDTALQRERLQKTYSNKANSHMNHMIHASENTSQLSKYAHICLDQNTNIDNCLVVKKYLMSL